MVIDVPTILPHGTRIDTTSDGFLLWLPSSAPAHPSLTAAPPPSPPMRLISAGDSLPA